MNESFNTRARVGALIALGLVILAFAVTTVGSRRKLFTRSAEYVVSFRSVGGLKTGSSVLMHGVHIGTVEEVELLPDPGEQRIDVTVSIERKFAPLIRTDTVAQIKTFGILGDKYVLLSTERRDDARPVPPGGPITSMEIVDYDELIRQSEDVLTNVAIISSSMRQMLLGLQKGESLLGKMISDPVYGDETSENLRQAAADASALLKSMREGRGLAGRLLTDEELGREVSADLRDAARRINVILDTAERGDSIAGKFFTDHPEGRKLFADVSAFAGALREISDAFEKEDGFLPALIKGSDESRRSIEDFHSAIRHLSSIMKKVDEGEGSAAGFINNPDIYEGLEDIVLGIRGSKLTKWYLRKKALEGQKLREQKGEGAKPSEEKKAPKKEGKPPSSPPPKAQETALGAGGAPPPSSEEGAAPARTMSAGEIRALFQSGTMEKPSETVVAARAPRDPFLSPPGKPSGKP
jgi:phospholipid/cholesterol/gamma-HCH transport system substrate-binding protein